MKPYHIQSCVLAALVSLGCTGAASTTSSGSSGSGGATTASSSASGSHACIPGKVYPCLCPKGAGGGVQTCQASGEAFGPCLGCDPVASSVTSGASSSSGAGGAGPADPCPDPYPPPPYG